jgi:hypothetical protein
MYCTSLPEHISSKQYVQTVVKPQYISSLNINQETDFWKKAAIIAAFFVLVAVG